jgi:hypothetical protein
MEKMMTQLDGHMHIIKESCDKTSFDTDCKALGINGGIIISQPPPSYKGNGNENEEAFCQRLGNNIIFCSDSRLVDYNSQRVAE